jgi:peptidoglycan/LPS O-acetylase OafA/YrhL
MSLDYRKDIDGLRAISIIPVVLFHAGISIFSGGYVGVDIFFVISGYLITSIILSDIKKGRFSISSFYFRRFKRIFPALFTVFFVTSIATYILFTPYDFKCFGKSLIGASLFISNIVFWADGGGGGYFNTSSESKPLLHTWSLSVEEQFYIFFPMTFYLLYKYKFKYSSFFAIILIFSFIISVSLTLYEKYLPFYFSSERAYYLPINRAWEILIGSMLAIVKFPEIKNRKLSDILSFFSIVLIFLSIFLYDKTISFPGYAAVLPCLGSSLLIYLGKNKNNDNLPIINKFLALKPFVFIGLISYSWYLWHWIIFSIRNYFKDVIIESFFTSNLFLITLTFVISVISYYFVESPFRNIKCEQKNKVFFYSFLFTLLFSIIGILIYKELIKQNHINENIRIYSYQKIDRANYTQSANKIFKNLDNMKIGNREKEISYIIWGDSHAGSLAPGLNEYLLSINKSAYTLSGGQCIPVFEIGKRNDCINFNNEVKEFILRNKNKLKHILILAIWESYINSNDPLLYKNKFIKDKKEKYNLFKEKLESTINFIQSNNIKVTFLVNVPIFNFDIPQILSRGELVKEYLPQIYKPYEVFDEKFFFDNNKKTIEVINYLSSKNNKINFLYLHKALLKDNKFIVNDENKALFIDTNHLSTYGAKYVVKNIKKDLDKLLNY